MSEIRIMFDPRFIKRYYQGRKAKRPAPKRKKLAEVNRKAKGEKFDVS